ncbi:MAG: glycerophosphodiester phosphodiesterase, partial [Candidatus Thorarchaeota archaeon]
MTKPLVIGHRGSPAIFPENTIESFETAISQGADMFELDLQESSDGHLVIIHDNDVERISGHKGLVAEMNLKELKVPDVESATLDVVKKYEMMDDVIFSSFLHDILKDINELDETATTAV